LRRKLIGNRGFMENDDEILKQTRLLPASVRYAKLADFVLPSEANPNFNLRGVNQALDTAIPMGPVPEGRRVLLGGKFEAPVIELIAAAKEANKLDELLRRIQQVEFGNTNQLNQRCKLALTAAICSLEEKDQEARSALEKLHPLAKNLPLDAAIHRRWPDLIACLYAMHRPQLLQTTRALLDVMNDNVVNGINQGKNFDGKPNWEQLVRLTRARAQVLSLSGEPRKRFGSDPDLRYWSPVAAVEDWTRGQGRGVPQWLLQGRTIRHYPGHQEDFMYFNVPMRGDFEVSCDLTAFGWREMHPAYGALRFDVLYTLKEYVIHTIGQGTSSHKIEPKLPEPGDAYRLRLVVKDGTYTTYVNDRKLAEEYIGSSADPWLFFHCSGMCTGEMRNLKITGNPTVPESINLMTLGFDMRGWRGYELRGHWERRGGELFDPGAAPKPGKGRSNAPRGNQIERTLFYHRPMLEDGEFAYEFYYEKDKALVHPAFDRLAFMLEPDGVKIHTITDGPNERSGQKIDNLTVEPNNRRGGNLPLNDKAWNKMRLILKGDVVTLQLNGQEIYQRAVEPANQRFFGLFHYTDTSEARVRLATYSGDWPKRLPSEDEIFLKKE
jgi:hypothetical protein